MKNHRYIRLIAAAALAGSAVTAALVVGGPTAIAGAKAPVAATCTGISGSTTLAIELGGTASSIISGCTSSSKDVTASGIDNSTLDSSFTGGSGEILWTNGKNTTYTYAVAATSGLTCGTYMDLAASGQETITISAVAGTAKVTAGGSFNVCYWDTSDGSVYETSVGSVTI
jgi:hypothetical protein